MAHYGKFSGVTNYIAMIGKKGSDLGIAKYHFEVVADKPELKWV